MKTAEIQRILKSLNANTTGFQQIPQLRYLILTNDSNHFYDHLKDFISFDFDNELIRIKEYTYEPISGRFDKMWTFSGNTINFKKVLKNLTFPFRKPQKGDIVFFVNKKTNEIYKTKYIIKELYEYSLVLDSTVNINNENYICCYADPEKFTSAIQFITDGSLLLYYTPRTNYVADFYLSFVDLEGIALNSSLAI